MMIEIGGGGKVRERGRGGGRVGRRGVGVVGLLIHIGLGLINGRLLVWKYEESQLKMEI